MIIEEYLKEGTLVRHTSDAGVLIRQIETGAVYGEAVDVVPCRYTYEETDIPENGDEPETDEATAEDYQAALEEMGCVFDD